MAKKELFSTGKSKNQFDKNLDFDFDLDLDLNPPKKKKGSKAADFTKGMIKGIKSSVFSTDFIKTAIETSIPSDYGKSFDQSKDLYKKLSSLYNDSVQEIKPKLNQVAKEVDKLVPAEKKRVKGYLDKLKEFTATDSGFTPLNAEKEREENINSNLEQLFLLQAENDANDRVLQRAEGKIKDQVDLNRFNANNRLLGNINTNISRLAAYNDTINNRFQKKSLELQYRSYFTQADILATNRAMYETLAKQNNELIRLAAMSDYEKAASSKSRKDKLASKFKNSFVGALGIDKYKENLFKKLDTYAKEKKETAKNGLDSVSTALNMFNMLKDTDLGDQSMSETLGEMAGSYAPSILMNIFKDNISEKIFPKGSKQSNKLASVLKNARDPNALAKKIKDSKFLEKNWSNDGISEKMKDELRTVLDLFITRKPELMLGKRGMGLGGLNEPMQFDGRTHKTVNSIIPGYLSRIYRELQVIRTGNNSVELTEFNYGKDKFMTSKSLDSDLMSKIKATADSFGLKQSINDSYTELLGDKKLKKDQEELIKKRLAEISINPNIDLNVNSVFSDEFLGTLSRSTSQHIKKNVVSKYSGEQGENQFKLTNVLGDIRDSAPDLRELVEELLKMYGSEPLERLGLIDIKRNPYTGDTYNINQKKYQDLLNKNIDIYQEVQKNVKTPTSKAKSANNQGIMHKLLGSSTIEEQAESARANIGNFGLSDTDSKHLGKLVSIDDNMSRLLSIVTGISKKRLGGMDDGKILSEVEAKRSNTIGGMLDGVLDAFRPMANTALKGLGNLANSGLKAAFKIPGMLGNLGTKLGDTLKQGKENITNVFARIQDIYIPGETEPRLKAAVLQAGGYIDVKTKKVIKTLGDITGPVSDLKGRVILSLSDYSKGLIDDSGRPIRSLTSKLQNAAGKAFDMIAKGANAFIPRVGKTLMNAAKAIGKELNQFLEIHKDIYVKGEDTPRLYVTGIRTGAYFSKKTRKPIKFVRDIDGPIEDSDGNIVISLADMSKGLVYVDGKSVLSRSNTILTNALAFGKYGINQAKKVLKSLASKFKFGLPDINIGRFTSLEQIDLLTQIRDILDSRLPNSGDNNGTSMEDAGGESSTTTTARSPSLLGRVNTRNIANLAKKAKTVGTNAKKKIEETVEGNSRLKGLKDKFSNSKVGGWLSKGVGKATGMFNGAVGFAKGLFSNNENNADDTNQNKTAEEASKETEDNQQEESVKRDARGRFISTKNKADSKARAALGKKRTGTSMDSVTAAQEVNEAKRAELESNKAIASTDPKYKSGKNIIDSMLDKVGDFKNMLGKAFDMLTNIPGLGKVGKVLAKVPLLGKLFGAGEAVAGAASAVGGASTLGTIGRAAMGIGSVGVSGLAAAANVAGTAAMAVGTGILSAVSAVVSSPVFLGAAAVAALGYGAYRGYKFITRNSASDLAKFRLAQYGLLDNKDDSSYYHCIFELEEMLANNAIGENRSLGGMQPYLIAKNIDNEKMLGIFDINPKDTKSVNNFLTWFNNRFKPVFLNHIAALYAISPKTSLSDVDSLDNKQKLKYLELSKFVDGPYNEVTSPFTDKDTLNATSVTVDNTYTVLQSKLKVEKGKDNKDPSNKLAEIQRAKDAEKANADTESNKSEAQKQAEKATADLNARKAPLFDPNAGTNKLYQKQNADINNKNVIDGESDKLGKATGTDTSGDDKALGKPAGINMADGALKDGSSANQYLQANGGVDFSGINPELMKKFQGMVQEYGEKTGNKTIVTSGYRDAAKQQALYQQDPTKAARPGRSLHQFGLALDVDSKTLDEMDKLGLMRKYGFTRPVGGEPWHTEPAGIQTNIDKAKNDANFASMAVSASAGRGGGGVGSIAGTPLGKRDSAYAMNLLNTDSSKIIKDTEKPTDILPAPNTTLASEGTPNITGANAGVSKPTLLGRGMPASRASGNRGMAPTGPSTMGQLAMNTGTRNTEPATSVDAEPGSLAKLKNIDMAGNSGDVKKIITDVANSQGVDSKTMLTMAAMESGMNPNARASGSTAGGLFQIIDSTWKQVVSQIGNRFGITDQTPKTDPKANTIVATNLIKTNLNTIKSVKSDVSPTDAYLAHFLGANGAKALLSSNPDAIAADVVPAAARANASLFYKNNKPLTVKEFYNSISARIASKAKEFGIDVPNSTLAANGTPQTDMSKTTFSDIEPVDAGGSAITTPGNKNATANTGMMNTAKSMIPGMGSNLMSLSKTSSMGGSAAMQSPTDTSTNVNASTTSDKALTLPQLAEISKILNADLDTGTKTVKVLEEIKQLLAKANGGSTSTSASDTKVGQDDYRSNPIMSRLPNPSVDLVQRI